MMNDDGDGGGGVTWAIGNRPYMGISKSPSQHKVIENFDGSVKSSMKTVSMALW